MKRYQKLKLRWKLPVFYLMANVVLVGIEILLVLIAGEKNAVVDGSAWQPFVVSGFLILIVLFNILPLLINPGFWILEFLNPCRGEFCFDYFFNIPFYILFNVGAYYLLGRVLEKRYETQLNFKK